MDLASTVQVDINGAIIPAFLVSYVILDSSSFLEHASMSLPNAQHLTVSMEHALLALLAILFSPDYAFLHKIS